jgi:hypothetical protein
MHTVATNQFAQSVGATKGTPTLRDWQLLGLAVLTSAYAG